MRTVRAALAEHGRGERNDELIEELDEVAVRNPLIEQLVVNRFTEVRDLLTAGLSVAVNDETLQRVVRRGLEEGALPPREEQHRRRGARRGLPHHHGRRAGGPR